ncbi:hypothetical protein CTI12_AA341680 [Artemisia annua]|uniref:Uncharacterized protein n=1 Tax=Artemisia annua TaxID=35608 RepID=A0A2U1MU55_ARTAN|nr:hypothetical protein CTI12_AA341680 [Artemisia annua]
MLKQSNPSTASTKNLNKDITTDEEVTDKKTENKENSSDYKMEETTPPPTVVSGKTYPHGWLIGKKQKLVNVDVVESMRRIAVQEMNRKMRRLLTKKTENKENSSDYKMKETTPPPTVVPLPDFDSASYPHGWLIGKKRKLVNVDVVESMPGFLFKK